jgi:Uncharacterized protein conserved in bacteria (DUF2252)
MTFHADNAAYEAWLRTQCSVVDKDLEYKHERMRKNSFVFLRATFFRWGKRVETLCSELKDAPTVLCVGDTHIENFGTWRDAEGRLVWGINDFDEAASMPYPFDLVRLAASVRLAAGIGLGNRDAAAAILNGYEIGLTKPRPTLLDEQETWMRPFVGCSDDDRRKFWTEVDDYPTASPPGAVADGLKKCVPEDGSLLRFASRVKGGGSLGRPRYIAIAAWRGGRVVREAKALVPSAWDWAHGATSMRSRFLDAARGRFRAPDPFLDVRGGFVFRRIAADWRKVEFGDHVDAKFEIDLLKAMGFDLGGIHAAEQGTAVIRDFNSRPRDWLHKAAKAAAAAVEEDFHEWTG